MTDPRAFVINSVKRLPASVQRDIIDLFEEAAATFEYERGYDRNTAEWLAWAAVWSEVEVRYEQAASDAAAQSISMAQRRKRRAAA